MHFREMIICFRQKQPHFCLLFTLQTSTGTCARCKTLILESQHEELDGGSDIGDKEFEWFRIFEFGPG